MERIKRISEAYSMQPGAKEVCRDPSHSKLTEHSKDCIEAIEYIIDPNKGDRYIGLNFKGKKLFEWLVDGCHVEYFTND